jgi:hypothetical protein
MNNKKVLKPRIPDNLSVVELQEKYMLDEDSFSEQVFSHCHIENCEIQRNCF